MHRRLPCSARRAILACASAAVLAVAGAPLALAEDTPDDRIAASGAMGPPAPADLPRSPLAVDMPDETPADVAALAEGGAPVTQMRDALRLAYWTSPTVLAQRATTKGTDYRVPQARAGFGPRLDFQASYGYQRDRLDQVIGSPLTVDGFSSTATAILTQPLFTFGRTAAQERFALAQTGFQREVLRSTEQQAALDAITAYVGLLRDRAQVAVARDNLDTLTRELSDNRARFKVREVTSTDVQQVETRVEIGRAQLFAAQRDAATAEATFARAVGAPAGTLAPPNPLDLPVRTLEDAYAYAESHNPVIAAAQQREKVSRASYESAKADLMPRVDLRGQAQYGSVSPYSDNLRQTDFRGEVVVSGPIYESGLRQARLGEAKNANDADWRLIDAAVRESRATIATQWNEWQTQQAAIDRYAGAVESARNAYEGALLQERAGMRTTLDVLDLARELLQVRSAYNAAIAGAYIAQARVLAAIGALEQRWLMPDDPRYDPASHFEKVKHRGDVPLLTPLLKTLDALPLGNSRDRPLRDPGTQVETPPVALDPVVPVP